MKHILNYHLGKESGMNYLSFFINRVSLDVDFYNNEDYAGDSILPFMGFMMFLIGLVVVIVGAAIYFTAKHNFNIFYDTRDVKITYDEQMLSDDEKAAKNNEKLIKDKKKGRIIMIIGAVLIVASFVAL